MRALDLRAPGILDESLVVSASAGSGKTFTLTVLVTAHLGQGRLRPFEILATTFSEAAAADLRERLLRPLDLLASLGESAWRELLPVAGAGREWGSRLQALAPAERLRKSAGEVAEAAAHWAEAPWTQSPARARAFWRRTRREAELLQVSTIHALALRVLGRSEGAPERLRDVIHPALLRLLRQTLREDLDLAPGHPDRAPARRLLAWAERHWPDLSRGHDQHRDGLGHLDPVDLVPLRAAALAALDRAEQELAPFAADPQRALEPASPQRRHFKPRAILRIPGPAADLDGRLRWAEAQCRRVEIEKTYYAEAFRNAMGSFEPLADALEAWLRALLVGALRRFEERKAEQGQATFGDLVRLALDHLNRDGLGAPAPKLLLVDEYQDTSRSQDAFLAALGAERRVLVGDVKQAIYGFRGGDPDLLRAHLTAAGDHACRLPFNFRSTPPVVALANRYVNQTWPELDPGGGDPGGAQTAVGAGTLPVGLVRSARARADLPALADWIAGLSRPAGWDRCFGAPAAGGPRRRTLLLKQRTRLPALLQRLKRQGIQPYVVAQSGFWDSPGVRLLLAALEAVAHPERPTPCMALLRNLAGLDDAAVTRLALARDGRLPGLGRLDPDALPAAQQDTARWLLTLRQASTQELAGRILAQGALLASVAALRIHGESEPLRARRNLAALLSLLLELPASPAVAWSLLEDERSGVERGDLPAPADTADLLIQTVHASKGLEYDDVILPLLNAQPRAFRHGELRTRGGTGELLLAWKLGHVQGAAYRELKPLVEGRQRRDELNLLYVAITRARERLCLLLQEPNARRAPAESKTWAQWGQHLADAHPELALLDTAPVPDPPPARTGGVPEPPPPAAAPGAGPEAVVLHQGQSADSRARALQEGEAVHAFLRDLLVRWEDSEAFAACLAAAPEVAHARENALRFLQQFEARGWRHQRRRSELPLAGAAASGALGRADLVVWAEDRIHLLDFKHSSGFDEAALALYRAQLGRYAAALEAREGQPVEAWLVALRSGQWVALPRQDPAG